MCILYYLLNTFSNVSSLPPNFFFSLQILKEGNVSRAGKPKLLHHLGNTLWQSNIQVLHDWSSGSLWEKHDILLPAQWSSVWRVWLQLWYWVQIPYLLTRLRSVLLCIWTGKVHKTPFSNALTLNTHHHYHQNRKLSLSLLSPCRYQRKCTPILPLPLQPHLLFSMVFTNHCHHHYHLNSFHCSSSSISSSSSICSTKTFPFLSLDLSSPLSSHLSRFLRKWHRAFFPPVKWPNHHHSNDYHRHRCRNQDRNRFLHKTIVVHKLIHYHHRTQQNSKQKALCKYYSMKIPFFFSSSFWLAHFRFIRCAYITNLTLQNLYVLLTTQFRWKCYDMNSPFCRNWKL